jgi:hypothetical protein
LLKMEKSMRTLYLYMVYVTTVYVADTRELEWEDNK